MTNPLDTNNPFADPFVAHFQTPEAHADADPYRNFFRAKLTGKTDVSGVWNYDWTEQTFDRATGELTDANPRREGGIVGGDPFSPAIEVNNVEIDLTGDVFVFMRQKGVVNGQMYYEFEYTPGSVTVEEADGSPSYTGITTLRFDQADGFTVTNPATGVARIDWTPQTAQAGCGLTVTGGQFAIDTAEDSTTTETLVTDATLALYMGNLRLSVTKRTYTNHFNACGVLIDRTVGSPTTTDTDIDPCTIADCCDATALSVVATADPESGAAPLDVDFTATPSGGVSPYTYAWDFDDSGTSTSQNPSHTYSDPGTYEAVVTVTDACGRTATDSVVVTVGGVGECSPDAAGGAVTVAGVTDGACTDCNRFNVAWTLTNVSPGVWEGTVSGVGATWCGGPGGGKIQLTCDGVSDATLAFFGGPDPMGGVYKLALASWNQFGANVMSYDAGGETGACASWPATLTVTMS